MSVRDHYGCSEGPLAVRGGLWRPRLRMARPATGSWAYGQALERVPHAAADLPIIRSESVLQRREAGRDRAARRRALEPWLSTAATTAALPSTRRRYSARPSCGRTKHNAERRSRFP